MTFDESNAAITDHLCGRTIERVERRGKLLAFVCADGREVTLQADVCGDIHFRAAETRVYLPSVAAMLKAGM